MKAIESLPLITLKDSIFFLSLFHHIKWARFNSWNSGFQQCDWCTLRCYFKSSTFNISLFNPWIYILKLNPSVGRIQGEGSGLGMERKDLKTILLKWFHGSWSQETYNLNHPVHSSTFLESGSLTNQHEGSDLNGFPFNMFLKGTRYNSTWFLTYWVVSDSQQYPLNLSFV